MQTGKYREARVPKLGRVPTCRFDCRNKCKVLLLVVADLVSARSKGVVANNSFSVLTTQEFESFVSISSFGGVSLPNRFLILSDLVLYS